MYDSMSEAAGRIVDQLSRRRFVGWLGKGGLALAGALGLEKLCGVAFGQQQTPCPQLTSKDTLPNGTQFAFLVCADKHCPTSEEALRRLCLIRANCSAGQCDAPKHCTGVSIIAGNVHAGCHTWGVNESGKIVGFYSDADGKVHGFLAIPVH